MEDSLFFNRQNSGLRLHEFEREIMLTKKFQVVATFKDEHFIHKDLDTSEEGEFIAIMEGLDLPIYIITYNIEMT